MQFFPPQATAGRGFGFLEFGRSELTYRASLEAAIAPNRPHHLILRAAGLPPNSLVSVDVPEGTVVHGSANSDGTREWDLDVPPGSATRIRASLALTLPAKGTIPLPAVNLSPAGSMPQPLGQVRSYGTIGLPSDGRFEGAVQVDLASIGTAWPAETERLRRANGSAWSAAGLPTYIFQATLPSASVGAQMPAVTPVLSERASSTASTRLLQALAWCGAALGLGILIVRFPQSTWPEQIGMLGGMFGAAVVGSEALGIVVYVMARAVWLVLRIAVSKR
jgi:hypothetical protein